MRCIAIVGPTASGKTGKAVALARRFDGEIVSCDSRQLYRRMDLGTGKDLNEYGDVPYHLIDVCEPGEKYNLYRFLTDARRAIIEIESRGKMAILCGGTGMYVESLIKGVKLPDVPVNIDLRSRLEGKDLSELTDVLSAMKSLHNTTDIDTKKRAIRAIEIQQYYVDHPEMSPQVNLQPVDALVVGVDIDRDIRRRRISDRLQARLDAGMIDEVQRLIDDGVAAEDLIYYGLEYKYLTLHVLGKLTYPEMKDQLETAIHQFAKRQMTWFRGMERRGTPIHWLPWDMSENEFCNAVMEMYWS